MDPETEAIHAPHGCEHPEGTASLLQPTPLHVAGVMRWRLTLESHSLSVLMLMKDTSPLAPVMTPSCSQRTIRSMSSPSFHLRYLQGQPDSFTTRSNAMAGASWTAQGKACAPTWSHPPRADVPVSNRGDLILIHVILHKWIWVGKIVSFSSLQK